MFQDDIQRQVSQLEKLQKQIEKNIDIDERIIPTRDRALFSSFFLPIMPQINPAPPKRNPAKRNKPHVPKAIDRIPSKFDLSSLFIFFLDISYYQQKVFE